MDSDNQNQDVSENFGRTMSEMHQRIERMGSLDYAYLKGELKKLSQPLDCEFDPNSLSRAMMRIQGLKDRAVEIVSQATENYLIRKRAVEVLVKGWSRFSVEKSAEKREGDAYNKFSEEIMDAAEAEVFYRHALGIMHNLESQMDNVSRQITCATVAAKIHSGSSGFDIEPAMSNKGDDRVSDPVTDWDRWDKN